MSSIFVTSHLVLGDVPTSVSGPRLRATSVREAVRIIQGGGTAVLPAGDFDGAAEVLRRFGASEEHIRFAVYTMCRDLRAIPEDPFASSQPPAPPREGP